MESRINGTLKTWNDIKGFGFITPLNGGQDIFVHISDYPKQGGLPKVGEPISFEVILNNDGKKKAVLVQRPGGKPVASTVRSRPQANVSPKNSLLERFITLVLVVMIGSAGYTFLAPKFNASSSRPDTLVNTQPEVVSDHFQCDGRTSCSEMTSCAEATFFIRNCPNTKMDGNGDGVPCESQWCTGPFAK
ncbi:MAG: cold shock domain-containing protein [Azonexus sp.]